MDGMDYCEECEKEYKETIKNLRTEIKKLKEGFLAICNFDSHIQQYECQLIKNDIAFDGCLWQELNWLWQQGIETVGCCCGHHINCPHDMAYIQVKSIYEQEMIDLGYKKSVNEFGAVLFKPKTQILESAGLIHD